MKKSARQRLDTWLERLDLADHRQKKVQELSKGMQQKAQIIATLLHDPDLVVIDEPFSGLDPVNTRLVKQHPDRYAGTLANQSLCQHIKCIKWKRCAIALHC